MKRFLIGSQYFFGCYEGFKGHDIDELQIINAQNFSNCRQLSGNGKCIF